MARPVRPYRRAKEMPFRLRQQSVVFFNERQYLQGLQFLNQLLTAGVSDDSHIVAVYAPLQQQIALAATLAVHPQFTTRAKSEEDLQVANEALKFLHNANAVIGSIQAGFFSAFAFESFFNVRRRKRGAATSPSQDFDEDVAGIRSVFATDKSLFSQAEDIWQIIGWAFNCSARWDTRWQRWKLWLDLLLDVLEDDWDEHGELVRKTGSDQNYGKSLIMLYLRGAGGRTERRRIMRAVLADGSEKSLQAFPEVFKNETRERRVPTEIEHKELNLDEDQWGDYDMDDEDDEVLGDLQSGPANQPQNTSANSSGNLGGPESIQLRQRLLTLLARVAYTPSKFTHLEDLYDLFAESLRSLPIPVFSQFVTTFQMPHSTLSGLLVNMMIPYVPSAPKRINIFSLNQSQLIANFLPYAANLHNSSDNAKMSLLVEAILFTMMSDGKLEADQNFIQAVEAGIKNRKDKAIGDARRKFKGRKGPEAEARKELEMSSERIMAILEVLEAQAGITPRQRFPDEPSSPLSSSISISSPSPEVIDLSDDSDIGEVIHIKID